VILKRREFLRDTTIASAALLWSRSFAGSKRGGLPNPSVIYGAEKSRVVIAHRNDLRKNRNVIDGDGVKKLVDAAIENLYQQNAKSVWKKLFSKKDIVGLKVNCLAGKGLSTHYEIVDAVVERLQEIGIPAHHIIIWDRLDRDLERAGYKLYQGRKKPQCYGNNRVGYTSRLFQYGSVGSLLSRIIHDQCTAIINLPILKDHGIVGVSIAMKNFFGAIDNPNKYHDDIGDPFVADVNMLPDIRKKTRLTICDAITPQYEGGPPYMPQWTWQMDSLIAATDMVALDRIGWDIIEQKRKEKGIESLKEAGREPTYIATAADESHKLGTDDLERIEIVHA